MDRVHVDRNPGGPLVVAGINQAGRDLYESLFPSPDHAMIAGQNLVLVALLPYDDGREKSIARDGFTQGR